MSTSERPATLLPAARWYRRKTDDRPNVLIVNQRMERTGAPIQLATLLKATVGDVDVRRTLLAGSRGPLTGVMAAHVDEVLHESLLLRAVSRVERHVPSCWRRLPRSLWKHGMRRRAGRVDVVYVNSLISQRLASAFDGIPMIVHLHELGTLAESLGACALKLLTGAEMVLVPSDAAADWVVEKGISREVVKLLPGTVPSSAFESPDAEDGFNLRADLGLPDDVRLVTTVGWIGHLKGSDRFLDVAERLAKPDPSVHFVWVGGGSGSGSEAAFRQAIHRRGLDDIITILPGHDDLRGIYAQVDIVLITSREESLSLVALEAAAQATPVVYFPGSGGPDSLSEEGITVRPGGPGPDGVAATVERLLSDTDSMSTLGDAAQRAVRQFHSVDVVRPIFQRAVTTAVLSARAGPP